MGYTKETLSIKVKLNDLYSDTYRCGFFKVTGVGDIAEEPFV